ncbi:hypothetical protein C8R43DRAFT_970387 [Mycena crocata]|nr:hypothetical protein C8R43DRAFT_970387 [Mycena crocata]
MGMWVSIRWRVARDPSCRAFLCVCLLTLLLFDTSLLHISISKAMAEPRPPLAPSASFSASTSSTSSISPSRPLKRRLLSAPDLNFFTPAADSFKPLPYAPHHTAPAAREPHPERVAVRPVAPHNLSTLSLDPLPTDPDTVFLRYPFASFPDQDMYPEGITYTALAENLNWFLVPEDYVSEKCVNPNPDAIPYPAALEPPRGWCPAKKKDLKEKGNEVWPEGEQPRLRCTFCRRTYAGVNAKSMWRRHVFEKHKIAMQNRRIDTERPRGRHSNKENKRAKSVKQDDSLDSILGLGGDATAPGAPLIPQDGFDPHLDISVALPASPASTRVIPPASPYDPLLTPSFRHCPPRLPSDQPWRFPSPSHPLHRSRELSLTMLGGDSPVASSPIVPKNRERALSTPVSSPCNSSLDFETPESLAKIRPFPRLFSVGRRGAGPLASTPSTGARRRSKTSSDVYTNSPLSLLGSDGNPFVAIWADEDGGSPPSSSPEGESPVVRSAARPTGVGLGIGLLEPFILPDSCTSADVDFDELMHLDDDGDEAEVLDVLTCSQGSEDPPLKKRRTTAN